MKAVNISGKIRAAFCLVFHNLYVDVENNQPMLKRIRMSYVWDELEETEGEKAAKDPELAMCGAKMPLFSDIRDWIQKVLTEESSLSTSKSRADVNIFLLALLKLAQSLVVFGYYTNYKDITNVSAKTKNQKPKAKTKN